jgi:hypothetical protein
MEWSYTSIPPCTYCTRRDNFYLGWSVECRNGASVLDVQKKKKGHKEFIESEGKCNKQNLHVKFSLRFVRHDELKVYEEKEVQLHSFLTMTLN